MSYLINCPNLYTKEYKPKYKTFTFELDHFQKYACEGIDLNENVFVAVATGSGKTVPAEYAIAKALSENNKVVYISPIKALSNQKYNDFSKNFSNIGIMTGDNKVNPQANLVIMTAEIFRNSLYKNYWEHSHTKKYTDNSIYTFDPTLVKYVILDEIHYINDRDRGKVWEEILMLLPNTTQLTMLSATIDHPEILANWVGEHQKKNTRLITQYKRPVPLKFYLINNIEKKLLMETDKKWKENVWKTFEYKKCQPIHWINHTIKILEQEKKLPSIFFTLSKKNIFIFSTKIIGNFLNYEEISLVKKIWNDNLLKFSDEYKSSTQFIEVYNLVIRGIGYHHSGIIPILKEIIEILYSKKLIKVLLATETFAVGVNMPTKTVIFTGLYKYDNMGRRLLRTDEFLQMAGRAGRRGLDTFGEVIILPNNLPTEDEFKGIILGSPLRLKSRLKLDYSWILKNLHNLSNSDDKITNLILFAKKSFLERNTPEQINKIQNEILDIENKIKHYKKYISDDYEKEYLTLISNIKKSNKKQNKIYKNKLMIFKSDKKFNYLNKLLELKDYSSKLYNKLGIENKKLYNHFTNIIKYMENQGFIKNYILTDLGLLLKEINEINPLIFSYMAFKNYFDDITFDSLVAFLSIFLEAKENYVFLEDLDINNYDKELLQTADKISNYFLDKECELVKILPYPLLQDYKLNLNNYNIIKKWSQGLNWVDIKFQYNDFEGNFSKIVLRLHNLLKEIKIIFEILKKDRLVKMIDEKQDTLIREFVQTDSLYLI